MSGLLLVHRCTYLFLVRHFEELLFQITNNTNAGILEEIRGIIHKRHTTDTFVLRWRGNGVRSKLGGNSAVLPTDAQKNDANGALLRNAVKLKAFCSQS